MPHTLNKTIVSNHFKPAHT